MREFKFKVGRQLFHFGENGLKFLEPNSRRRTLPANDTYLRCRTGGARFILVLVGRS